MAKIAIKSEKLTPFGGFFQVYPTIGIHKHRKWLKIYIKQHFECVN